MTQAQNPNKVEAATDTKVAAQTHDTASDARNTLSTSALDLMKEGAKNAAGGGDASGSRATKNVDDMGSKNGIGSTSELEQLNKIVGKPNDANRVLDNGPKHGMESGIIKQLEKGSLGAMDSIRFQPKVTDQDRQEAKAALEKGISSLVPEADRKLQVSMQNAIIDGDVNKFKEVVKSMANDPEKLAKMVKEVNDTLNKNENFGGVELSMDSKGNVLLYGEKGNTAVSVNPKTGETTLRAVERQADGSVLLKDGEVLNKKPDEVMKDLGNEATRSITESPFKVHPIHPIEKPPFFPPFKPDPRDLPHIKPNGGGDGGGGEGKPHHFDNKEELNITPLKELQK